MASLYFNLCIYFLTLQALQTDAAKVSAVKSMRQMLAASTLAANGVPDPTCSTGIISLKGLVDKAQVCCAAFCGECSDYPDCSSVRGHDSSHACCKTKIYESRCGGGAPANTCTKKCSTSVPPCIMDANFNFKQPKAGTRNAASDCNKALTKWRAKAASAASAGKKVAEKILACPGEPNENGIKEFEAPVCGRSPGKQVIAVHKDVANLKACERKCLESDNCRAVIYKPPKKTCVALSRTYNEKYEKAKDDVMVANRIMPKQCPEEPGESSMEGFGKPKCGKSPGKQVINVHKNVKSLNDCQKKCLEEKDKGCKAVIYRPSPKNVCITLGRTYDKNFVKPGKDENVMVANRILKGCPEEPAEGSIDEFGPAKCGKSPGKQVIAVHQNMGSLEACQRKCMESKDCMSVIYRPGKKVCIPLSRLYDDKYETAKDDVMVANRKFKGCPAEPDQSSIHQFGPAKCGKSPGKQVIAVHKNIERLEACQRKCMESKECLSVIYKPEKKVCIPLSRLYNDKFVTSNENIMVANKKLKGCPVEPSESSMWKFGPPKCGKSPGKQVLSVNQNIKSLEECQRKCLESNDCKSVIYRPSPKNVCIPLGRTYEGKYETANEDIMVANRI